LVALPQCCGYKIRKIFVVCKKMDFFAKKLTARNRGAMGFVPKDENDMSVPLTPSRAAEMA